MSADVPSISLSTLANFISSGVAGLTVLQEWPYANQKLAYPSLTITPGKPKRTPQIPYTILTSAVDSKGFVTINNVVASWDCNFQMDLWCRNKDERKQFSDAIISLFDTQESDGLSLAMSDHFGEFCRYEIDTIEHVDDEAGAQRQERRDKIMVIINCREVRQKTYYAMTKIQVHTQVTPQQIVDDDSNTDIVSVQ